MSRYNVCRILKDLNQITYNYISICNCKYYCKNNKKTNLEIPYIVCKKIKTINPYDYYFSASCNCKLQQCRF